MKSITRDPLVTLVNFDGTPYVAPEEGASTWPASNEVDGWFWTTPPDDVSALEAAEMASLLSDSGLLPEMALSTFVPSDADWADFHTACDDIDRGVSADELAVLAAGLAVG